MGKAHSTLLGVYDCVLLQRDIGAPEEYACDINSLLGLQAGGSGLGAPADGQCTLRLGVLAAEHTDIAVAGW